MTGRNFLLIGAFSAACVSFKWESGAGDGDNRLDISVENGLIGFDPRPARFCLFAVQKAIAMMTRFELANGEGIVATDGDRTNHRSQEGRISCMASTISLPCAREIGIRCAMADNASQKAICGT